MYYVYLIQSESDSNQKYYGITEDLKVRIKEHNTGKSPHTSKFTPWKLVTYIAFSDKYKPTNLRNTLKAILEEPFLIKDFGSRRVTTD